MNTADTADQPVKLNPRLVRIPRPRIYVTPEIAARACKQNSRLCMIREAILDKLPHATHITVDLMTIRWSDPRVGLRYTYLTPKICQEALLRFDFGIVLKGFNFQLRGGHASTMFIGGGSPKGGGGRQVHRLGKKQILTADEQRKSCGIIDDDPSPKAQRRRRSTNWTEIVETVGGRAPARLSPAHASNQNHRMFGLKGFSPAFINDFLEATKEK